MAGGVFRPDFMMKAQQWERAKGELRALVAMQGSFTSGGGDTHETTRWRELGKRVESFIKSVEDDGLEE